MQAYDWLVIVAPELILLLTIFAILILDGSSCKCAKQLQHNLSCASLIGAALALYWLNPNLPKILFKDCVILDNFALVAKIFILLASVCILIYSKNYMRQRDIMHSEYYALTLLSVIGSMLVVSAGNFLGLYLGLELMALPLYALVVFQKNNYQGSEAGLKYFIIGCLGATLFLYGISLIYAAHGDLDFASVVSLSKLEYKLGVLFVLIGLFIEFGVFPFHMWLPDVYQAAPVSVSLLIATLPKISVFAALMRLLSSAFSAIEIDWVQLMLFAGLASIIFGNLLALLQVNVKRLLAYATVSHIGFILLAMALAPVVYYTNALFYMINYAITMLALFGVLLKLSSATKDIQTIYDLNGLGQTQPWTAFLFVILLLSLAGIPPTLGFHAKYLILQALLDNNLWQIALVSLVFSVVGMYYYLNIIKLMYFCEPKDGEQSLGSFNFMQNSLLSFNALTLLFLGCAPACLFYVIKYAT